MKNIGKLLLLGGAGLGGMALVNRRIGEAYRPLPGSVDGEPGGYVWRDGVVYYHTKGDGEPMVLLHGFHHLSGPHEMRPVYDDLAADYRVTALDWLGYGQSNRPPVEQTAGVYQQLLADFLEDVIRQPAIIVASGPGAAFAVRLARRQPEKVSRLVLINPTGVDQLADKPSCWHTALGLLFKLPIVGDFAFNLATCRSALRWELENRIFFEPGEVTESLVDRAWVTSHQPGAKWAPLSYWSGRLNLNIAGDLGSLQQPTMIAWGQQAQHAPIAGIRGFKRYLPEARYRAFDRTREWPQVEDSKAFNALLRNWLQGKDHGAAAIFPGEVEPQ